MRFASSSSVASPERLLGSPRNTDDFDICPRPDGTEGYSDLIRRAVDVEIGGTKYLSHLPLLREVQEQRRARGLD
jgi:hypothetical protein